MNSARNQRVAPVISQPQTGTQASGTGAANAQSRRDRGRASGSTHTRFLIIPTTTDIAHPIRAPYFHIPEGCMVRVRATSTQAGGNVSPVFVGTSWEQVAAGAGSPTGNALQSIALQPLDDVQLQVDNMAEIWFAVIHAGDGVELSVMTQPAPQ